MKEEHPEQYEIKETDRRKERRELKYVIKYEDMKEDKEELGKQIKCDHYKWGLYKGTTTKTERKRNEEIAEAERKKISVKELRLIKAGIITNIE